MTQHFEITQLRPYFVHMTCGHYEIRLMREATAGQRWNTTATVEAGNSCRHCQRTADPHSYPHLHERDTQCCIDWQTASCIVCGVTFGDPCPTCRGRGFHFPGCDSPFGTMCKQTFNGLHCGKEAGHEGSHSFEPRCEGGA